MANHFESATDNGNFYIPTEEISQENNVLAMGTNGNGHVCTNPDEHGPKGNGNGYGHYKVEVESPQNDISPLSTTKPYGGNVRKKFYSQVEFVIDDWIPEDLNDAKNIKDGVPTDYSDGVSIDFHLDNPRSKEYNDAYFTTINLYIDDNDGEPVKGGKFRTGTGIELEDGTTFTDIYGNVFTVDFYEGDLTITIDSSTSSWKPVDLSSIKNLYYIPYDPYSDADFNINYLIDVENEAGGSGNFKKSIPVAVDAVADLPVCEGGADNSIIVGPSPDAELTPDKTEHKDGMAVQVIKGTVSADGTTKVYNLGNFTFKDYEDDSEEHFLLVKVDTTQTVTIDAAKLGQTDSPYAAFEALPEGAKLEIVCFDGKNIIPDDDFDKGNPNHAQFYKINIANSYLKEHEGKVNLQLPVTIKGGTDDREYILEVNACARERVTQDDVDNGYNDEWDWDNNFAFTPVNAVKVKVQSIESKVTISTGWAYESGADAGNLEENQNANPGVTDGQASFLSLGSAAFIDLKLDLGPNEELGDYINLTFAPNIRGTIYLEDGTPRSSGMTGGDKGLATILRSDFSDDGHLRLYFVPDSGNDDVSDVSISYTFDIISNGADGQKTFTAKGEIPLVIDAVADPAKIEEDGIAPTKEAPDTDGFVLNYKAEFSDDPAETQYIVIHNPGNLKLKLDVLGDAGRYLTQVKPSELKKYENADLSIGHHFGDPDENDVIILRIDDLKELDLLDKSADGKVDFKLPFEILNRSTTGDKLNLKIDTVVVHGGGNNANEWNKTDETGKITDREYDLGNNIAVTSKEIEVELSSGQMTIGEIDPVYESDRSQPHTNNVGTPEYGTPINLSFADPCEALREISFKLSAAGDSTVEQKIDGVMVFGLGNSYTVIEEDDKVLFTAKEVSGKAYYTKATVVKDNGERFEYTFEPAVTLDELHGKNDYSGLRFIPTGDSDIDVKVEISTRVMDVRSGDVVTSDTPEIITIVRDAVADMPTEVKASGAPEGGHPAFVASSGVTVKVSATFGDYKDGSENHYIFVSKANLASVTAPEGFELLKGDAAKTVCEQVDGVGGIPGATADDYFILKVSAKYLQDHGGTLTEVPLSGKLHDGAAADGSATIEIKAVAVERDGFQNKDNLDLGDGNREVDKGNNVAVKEASATVTWATLENKFDITAEGPAYENDLPNQNTDHASDAGGAPIKIAPQDSNEVIDALTVTYLGEDGNAAAGMVRLIVDGNSLDIPTGTTLHFTYDAQNSTLCTGVSYTDAKNVVHSLSFTGRTLVELTEGKSAGDGLRYVPNASGNHSDVDVNITFSGTGRETQSGEVADFTQQTVQVTVDAVADKPVGKETNYKYSDGHTAIAESSDVSFTVDTSFADFGEYDINDDSEAHYLFINTRYFVDNTLTLKDAYGALFTDYTPVNGTELDALYNQTGLARDDAHVVLKINPSYLQSAGGKVSLTIGGTLKDAAGLATADAPQKTQLTFDVKAVAVEHQGYDTSTGKDNLLDAPHGEEVRENNNVAVTDIGVNFMWDALSGKFTLTTAPAFEGNQPDQNNGDFAAAKTGGALTITPEDDTEIFTSMTLKYSAAHGEMKLFAGDSSITLAPDAKVTFTYDKSNLTQIVRVECGGNTLDVPNKTLAELTGEGLRYVPNTGDNDDADINISITAETKETTTGTTGAIDDNNSLKATITVDAVADQPQDVKVSFTATGENNTVIVNDKPTGNVFDLALGATFGDYDPDDGSENHYFFISAAFISSVSGLPPELSQLDEEAAGKIVSNAGLSGKYIVLQVNNSYLHTHNGRFELKSPLKAHLDKDKLPEEPADQTITIEIKAGAIEYQGIKTKLDADPEKGHDKETDKDNNVSLEDMSFELTYARLENKFDVKVVEVYEGDAPGQNEGDYSYHNKGAVINFAPKDPSEVFDTLHVEYDDAEGSLYLDISSREYGNTRVELPNKADIAFTYRSNDGGAGATQCTVVTITVDDKTAIYTLTSPITSPITLHKLLGDNHLHYIPKEKSQDDADVTITFTGSSRETETNETGDFTHDVLVKVDAVADKPEKNADSEAANRDDAYDALDPARAFDISVDVTFGSAAHGFDLTDGSEKHYVFVSREYLASLTVPSDLDGKVRLLSDAEIICRQVDGATGIPGANSADWFVLEVDGAWLDGLENKGTANLKLEGMLKDAASLPGEGAELTLDMRAVAVEHQGFLTDTENSLDKTDDAGNPVPPVHGFDPNKLNNVAVENISASFTYAVADGDVKAEVTPAWEGQQEFQHEGKFDYLAGGAAITLAPKDDSEIFTELTLEYSDAHGALTLSGVSGDPVTLQPGAKLVFTYDSANPAECLSIEVWQPGGTAPSATLSYADASGHGLSLSDLTSGHLIYLPRAGDNDDTDVKVTYTGTVLDTDSGAEGPILGDPDPVTGERPEMGTLDVVVDAVADKPLVDESDEPIVVVKDGTENGHTDARPGETFTVTFKATFGDYLDGSEAHYIFIAKGSLPTNAVPEGIPAWAPMVEDPTELTNIFTALYDEDKDGIHDGPTVKNDYHVLKIDPDYLAKHEGNIEFGLKIQTHQDTALDTYHVDAKAVAIEHQGYATKVDGIDGGENKDIIKENNVAVTDMSFDLVVREFEPKKVTVTLESEWAFENDRSQGDEEYHTPADNDNNIDRDHGVRLLINGQGEGNVISSITFEYAMPSNGSSTHHRIESLLPIEGGEYKENPDVTSDYDTISKPGYVIVTVTANYPFTGVGDLHFIPGDNYDNDDVDITVVQVDVADPKLHTITSSETEDWGSGVAEGSEPLHIKVDAVAQAPEVGDIAVSNDEKHPVKAGEPITITGTLSYEDLMDGSEEHFLLLEIQDGYYPTEVTLTYNGVPVTFKVEHYQEGIRKANYTLQELVTEDDGQPHLFMKLPVDAYLEELKNGDNSIERMDGITFDATYQTREWALEGVALHVAAIATEDVEEVREFDPNTLEITNDELPFDKLLEQYIPGITVMENNTAITVAAKGAYVFWDEYDNDELLNFKGYVFENDRPSDHQREPAYLIDRPARPNVSAVHVEQPYPVSPELQPFDPVINTGRDYGTGVELKIPVNTSEIRITETTGNLGEGDFYFLPQSVWTSYMTSPAPLADTALAMYLVDPNGIPKAADLSQGQHTLVFIPKHEPYNAAHQENDAAGEASHKDHDFRFNYELKVNQHNSDGEVIGTKNYIGEDKVIRIDAVANQADYLDAVAPGAEQFSLWNVPNVDTTTEFDLTVGFHDLDGTEDHYFLVEMVPNFAFRCGSYYYRPGDPASVLETDERYIYTHVYTNDKGEQTFIRYHKIPVDMAGATINPVTGNATAHVEFIHQAGMPLSAHYPSSDLLSYGALTEDKTCSRWDSTDPTDPLFVNRKGADGEYSYENNTSVIIRNGVGNGAPDAEIASPDLPGFGIVGGGGETPGGSGGYIHWENGPGMGWSGGYLPVGGGEPGEYWKEDGPAGGGTWWEEQGKGGSGEPSDKLLPEGGGAWGKLPGGGIIGGAPEESGWTNNKWIASHSNGVAVEWVFENSTPWGHTNAGKYNSVLPTQVFLTGENPNASYVEIAIPDSQAGLIKLIKNPISDWYFDNNIILHSRATLFIAHSDGRLPTMLTPVHDPIKGWVFTVDAPNGELPDGDRLFMNVSPDSMGEDFQMGVEWYDNNDVLLSSGPVDVMVDAVAQWADFALDKEGGVYGVAGDAPTELVSVDVNAYFLDQDGSESNYVLVEKLPGVLALHKGEDGTFDAVREVYLEGKTYFMIEATKAEQAANKVHLEFSINEELTSPMYIEDFVFKGHHYDGMKVNIGTMTIEGQTGWGSIGDKPANWEYTLSNNTSFNLQDDALTIVISKANVKGGNSSIIAEETHDPDANLIWLDPNNPSQGLNLTMDHNDILVGLVFTSIACENGGFWYIGDDGMEHPVPAGVDMAAEYLAGKIFYRQDRYQDADASLGWTATVQDGLTTSSTATVSGTLTIAVDAVAKSGEITLGYPQQDKTNDTLTQTLTFADHDANEQHYAVIAPDLYRVIGKTADVWDAASGTWQTVQVETIFSPAGDPYYAVRVDDYLDAGGSVTVRFGMKELNVPNIEQFPVVSGGVSIEPNTGFYPDDREPVLTNNWAINTKVEFPGKGIVSTRGLAFTAPAIIEDDASGAPINLAGTIGDNDVLTSAVLTFSATATARAVSDVLGGPAGEQIATIVYNGQCYAVTLDGAGHAVASLEFGANGFDPAADFRIIWAVAHMENGSMVVDSWNHNAEDCELALTTAFTVRNSISGQTAIINGDDPDNVQLVARADAAENVSGQTTAINGHSATDADPVGAGADNVTITLTGEFEDVDGSEGHFLMLEIPSGWDVVSPMSGTFQTINNVRYLKVEVDGALANPTAEITLKPQDGLNRDVPLKTGAFVEEGNGHTAFTQGDPLTLHVSDVSATGISAAPLATQEDEPISLASLAEAALLRGDANDVLVSVTFTALRGGTLVDASGNELADLTFTRDQLASGNVLYRPAANYAGGLNAQGRPQPVVLGYDALIGESDTGATASITGQKLSLTITPVADAPTNLGGVSDSATLDNIQAGHKAAITVTLTGEFADVDGSEAHFLIVSAPQGVAVLKGEGYTVTSLTAAELAALDAVDPAFAASGTVYKIVLADSVTASVSLPVNLEITTTIYNGGELLLAGAASEVLANGTRDYGISIAPSVTLPPAVTPDFGNSNPEPVEGAITLDSLRGTSASGSLNMKVDPDGDSVTVSGVSFGGVEGAPGTVDGKPCHSVQGQHGTLHVFADGTYRYDLDASSYNTATQEVFDYQLTDAYGGTGQSTITINLATPNNAPTATPVSARLDSVRQNVVEGNLVLRDTDNDTVEVSGVNGSTTLVNLGTDDAPLWGFAAAGLYGNIQVFEQNGQWKYRYLLDEEHRGEVRDESFSFTVRDAHGMENASSIAVDLYNANTNPVAGKGSATLDTLRDADDAVSGSVALKDKEGDTVSLNAATGPNGAAGAWGTDDRGEAAFVVQGEHGVLYLYQSSGTAIQYRYVLTDQAAGGLNATETFTYHVDDGYLGTASSTISISLTNANSQPVINGTLNSEIDTLRTTTGEAGGSLTFSDPDYNPDAGRHDLVTLSGVSFNGEEGIADGQGGFTVSGAYGVFHISANGAYAYTLNADAAGETGREAFTVTVTDEFGAMQQKDVSIDLVLRNHNPQASNGMLKLDTWRDGGKASGSVTLYDADGDTVRVDSVTGTQPGTWGVDDQGARSLVARGDHGTIYLHEDGTYRYLLDADAAGQSGQDVFAYTVQDGFRGTDAGTITINLDNANTAPVLSGDLPASIGGNIDRYEGGLVQEEGRLTWTDMEGDAIASISIGGVALPASGEVSIAGQYGTLHVTMQTGGASYVYVLNEGLDNKGIRDVDSFDIVLTDEFGGTSSQPLEVNLSPLSHSPECDDVNVNWPTDSNGDPLSFAVGSLSFRDADLDYDPTESLTLKVNDTIIGEGKIEVQGLHGTLSIQPNGSFSYTVDKNLGQDLLEDFTYTVTDKADNSVSAHIYIRLSDNAPVFPNTGTTEAGIVPKGAEIDLAIFEDFSFLNSSVSSDSDDSNAPEPASAPGTANTQANTEPALTEPVEIDLVNVPVPYDTDATQSIA